MLTNKSNKLYLNFHCSKYRISMISIWRDKRRYHQIQMTDSPKGKEMPKHKQNETGCCSSNGYTGKDVGRKKSQECFCSFNTLVKSVLVEVQTRMRYPQKGHAISFPYKCSKRLLVWTEALKYLNSSKIPYACTIIQNSGRRGAMVRRWTVNPKSLGVRWVQLPIGAGCAKKWEVCNERRFRDHVSHGNKERN